MAPCADKRDEARTQQVAACMGRWLQESDPDPLGMREEQILVRRRRANQQPPPLHCLPLFHDAAGRHLDLQAFLERLARRLDIEGKPKELEKFGIFWDCERARIGPAVAFDRCAALHCVAPRCIVALL